jgi:hypothetical protein
VKETDALRHHVSTLRSRLKRLLQIEGDPFYPSRSTKVYCPRFRLSAGDAIRFPTPDGARWDGVCVTELAAGKILMSAEGVERVRAIHYVHAPGSEDTDRAEEETAQQRTDTSQQYSLAMLGLVDRDGSPNAIATTLLRVLREGGKVRAPKTDAGLIALDGWLSAFFGLEPPAFQYTTSLGSWAPLFSAESDRNG